MITEKLDLGTKELDFDRLKGLTSEEFANAVKESYDEEKHVTDFQFSVCIRKKNPHDMIDDRKSEHIVVSFGHFIFSRFFIYYPSTGSFHDLILNQELFEEIVEPHMGKIKSINKKYGHLKNRK